MERNGGRVAPDVVLEHEVQPFLNRGELLASVEAERCNYNHDLVVVTTGAGKSVIAARYYKGVRAVLVWL